MFAYGSVLSLGNSYQSALVPNPSHLGLRPRPNIRSLSIWLILKEHALIGVANPLFSFILINHQFACPTSFVIVKDTSVNRIRVALYSLPMLQVVVVLTLVGVVQRWVYISAFAVDAAF